MCNVPAVGLKPIVPQYEAGLSMEPMVCVPSATGTIPQATAAAEPLEDPPGVRFTSNGLVVGPDRPIANSVVTVLPMMTAPLHLSAKTHAASCFDRQRLKSGEFIPVGISAVSMMSLTAIGHPSTGERGLPDS
jgi:hypothetical protein